MTVKDFIDLANFDDGKTEINVWHDGYDPIYGKEMNWDRLKRLTVYGNTQNSYYKIDERLYDKEVLSFDVGYHSINLHI